MVWLVSVSLQCEGLGANETLKRTKLGDPDFVEGMQEYQDFMIRQSTADGIRRRILDTQTHNVSEYNPDGIESIDT